MPKYTLLVRTNNGALDTRTIEAGTLEQAAERATQDGAALIADLTGQPPERVAQIVARHTPKMGKYQHHQHGATPQGGQGAAMPYPPPPPQPYPQQQPQQQPTPTPYPTPYPAPQGGQGAAMPYPPPLYHTPDNKKARRKAALRKWTKRIVAFVIYATVMDAIFESTGRSQGEMLIDAQDRERLVDTLMALKDSPDFDDPFDITQVQIGWLARMVADIPHEVYDEMADQIAATSLLTVIATLAFVGYWKRAK